MSDVRGPGAGDRRPKTEGPKPKAQSLKPKGSAAMLREIGGVMAVVALTLQAGSDYRGQIEKYRSDRIAELTAPDGWLAVRGLFWLHEGANSAGSDPSSEIRLPGRTPK